MRQYTPYRSFIHLRIIFALLTYILTLHFVSAQSQEDLTVQLSATVLVSPPSITLRWKPITWGPPVWTKIYRKAKTATSWGTYLDSLPYSASITNYIDNAVVADSAYEYKVIIGGFITDCITFPAQTVSSGYIYAGIKAPAIHHRGTLILLVEDNLSNLCSSEITTLMDDIRGDGWQIIRHNFPSTASDVAIKAAIVQDYSSNLHVKAVLIVGHLAVPYSGKVKPDAHPEHEGAWPADVFYGDMDGTWTDSIINVTSGTYAANHNVPGDGKWDPSQIPSSIELQVSRIDLSNMPAFPATEAQLMKNYLAKDHAYKMNALNIRHRGVFNDAIAGGPGTQCGEGFSANVYRNWAPLISKDSITVAGYYYLIPYMEGTYPGSTGGYQWAFGAGGGSFTSCAAIGTTSDFVGKANNTIFSMYFGSYFGDWNVQDNFLRAPLCQNPPTLTNCWVSRPNWFFHHMVLGENIGYSTIITQNNKKFSIDPVIDTAYSAFLNKSNLLISVALMGDLTLRTDYIKPPSNVVVSTLGNNDTLLNWTASPESGVLGYHVYRADSIYGYYQRLNATMLSTTTYQDLSLSNGLKYYMVRPIKLQTTPSGTYFNLGIGVVNSIFITGTEEPETSDNVAVFPNPVTDKVNVVSDDFMQAVKIIDITGKQIYNQQINKKELEISTAGFEKGIYFVQVTMGKGIAVQKIIVGLLH